jgi:hypothetical protein
MTTETRPPDTKPLITVGEDAGTGGPRNAVTDAKSGLRYYTWQGQRLVSVTSARRSAGIPHNLHQWAISQVVAAALENWTELTAMLRSDDPAAPTLVRSRLRAGATAERDRKAALGTAVHDAAATGVSLADAPAEVAPFLRQYLDWLEKSKAEVLLAERQVWNLTLGYAGTFDLVARFPDGSTWIIDLKTGAGIYPDHAQQLMAYLMAEFVGNDDVVDEDATRVMRSVTGLAVLHLAAKSWEFVSIRPDAEMWRAFRGLLAYGSWMAEHSDIRSVTLGSRKGSAA